MKKLFVVKGTLIMRSAEMDNDAKCCGYIHSTAEVEVPLMLDDWDIRREEFPEVIGIVWKREETKNA